MTKRNTGILLLGLLFVAAFVRICSIRSGLAAATEAPQISAWFNFEEAGRIGLPSGFATAELKGNHEPAFEIAETDGKRSLFDNPAGGEDVLYYKTPKPMQAVEESYSFVYAGPDSVVEPFIVNAAAKQIAGTVTNLSASAPGNSIAGGVTYLHKDASGQVQYDVRGRLRTEPYIYERGHTYRVDAIADGESGIVTTRVYDVSLGAQTFDTRIKLMLREPHLYPGLLARHGATTILDFGFGPAGSLPVRSQPARSAGQYMNYLGYNASVVGPLSSPLSEAFQRYFPDLLIKHVRVPDLRGALPSLNAVSRYGIDADVLTGKNTTIDSLKAFISKLALPPDAIELWNEPNNPSQGGAYDSRFAVDLPAFAQQVVQAFPDTKIWGPSVLAAPNGYPQDVKLLAPSIGSEITAWNAHSYTVGAPENLGYGGFFSNACGSSHKEDCGWYGAPNYNDNVSAVMNPSIPGITSEGAASYGSEPQRCGHGNVDEKVQQAYIERGMLYNYKLGHLRIFPYKFIDNKNCSDGFGTYGIMSRLTNSDGTPFITPKPSYVSLVYLDHLLAPQAGTAVDFAPKPLSYTLVDSSPDVEELLLGQADGSYRLVLWSDKELWNFNANGTHLPGAELPLVAEPVKVQLAEPMSATVYTQVPGAGTWVKAAASRSATIPVVVDQFPQVIVLANPAHEYKDLLPAAVPTAGPTEPPITRRSL